jgi:hypothetical protein
LLMGQAKKAWTGVCGTILLEEGGDVMAQVALINGLVHVQKFCYLNDLLLYNRHTRRLVGWVTQVSQGDKHFSLPGQLLWI